MSRTAPTAVSTSEPCAIVMNRIVAAPPGSMTNGSRTPIFHTPTDCRIDPRPEKTKTADSTAEVVCASSPSAVAMRNTDEIGVATMTSTC